MTSFPVVRGRRRRHGACLPAPWAEFREDTASYKPMVDLADIAKDALEALRLAALFIDGLVAERQRWLALLDSAPLAPLQERLWPGKMRYVAAVRGAQYACAYCGRPVTLSAAADVHRHLRQLPFLPTAHVMLCEQCVTCVYEQVY